MLKILDEDTLEISHGCNQRWYTISWRRLAGCGPTAATNLIIYLYHTRFASGSKQGFVTKKICLALMDEVWEYVTPKLFGLSKTSLFYEGLFSYAKSQGLQIEYQFLDLPGDKSCRPGFSKVVNFLEAALLKDAPIAFLNLCNGNETNLESWHWVTIISVDARNDNRVFVDILDDGQIIQIDLSLWYNSTKKGGGFVYITD